MHGPHWVEFSNRRIRSCKASAGLLLLTFWWYWSSVRAGIWGPWRDNSWKVCKKLFYQFRYLRSKKSQDQIMVFRTTPNFVLYVFISFLSFSFLFFFLTSWYLIRTWRLARNEHNNERESEAVKNTGTSTGNYVVVIAGLFFRFIEALQRY